MKFCKKCNAETERYPSRQCKICAKAASAARRAASPDKANAYNSKWRANNQDKKKAYAKAYYVANSEKENTRNAVWRAVNKKYDAVYYAENTDKFKARAVAYRLENPEVKRIADQNRRARKRDAGGKLSKGLPAKLFELQKGKCACCKHPLGDNYHLDHIMPIALGGSNTDDNIQLLRATCNMQKSAKHPIDFMQSRGLLL